MTVEVIQKVSINGILPNPWQPESRINIDMLTAKKFADSIKAHGLLQIPICRRKDNRLEMGDGWLRLAGFKWLANNGDRNYDMMDVVVKDLTDKQMADLVMEANTVRQDLNQIELAQFYKKYLDSFKISQEELGRQHGVSQGEIANTLRLLDLPVEVQRKVITQEISPTHGRTLLQLAGKVEKMVELAGKIRDRNWSVADLDRAIKDILKPPTQQKLDPPKEQIPLEKEGTKALPAAKGVPLGGNSDVRVDPETGQVLDYEDPLDEDEEKSAADEKEETLKPEKPLEKVSLSELKEQARKKLRKVILTELPDGVRVAIGPEGQVPFIKVVPCDLGSVPLRMLLEEAEK